MKKIILTIVFAILAILLVFVVTTKHEEQNYKIPAKQGLQTVQTNFGSITVEGLYRGVPDDHMNFDEQTPYTHKPLTSWTMDLASPMSSHLDSIKSFCFLVKVTYKDYYFFTKTKTVAAKFLNDTIYITY